MIKLPTDFDTTVVYSTTNCVKCRMTKNLLTSMNVPFVEINIETDGDMDEYIKFLKGDREGKMAMPVVYPVASANMGPWNDFQNAQIKELANKLNQ